MRDPNTTDEMKVAARIAANLARMSGKIITQPCEKCGSLVPFMHKHHEDYTKPLDVKWLCKPCHLSYHGHARQLSNRINPNFYNEWVCSDAYPKRPIRTSHHAEERSAT